MVREVEAGTTLSDYLRCSTMRLTGTKVGCGEVSFGHPSRAACSMIMEQGGCGACTVMVSRLREGKVIHTAVNACLAPLHSLDHCHVPLKRHPMLR